MKSKKELLKEIEQDGFYTFIRRNIVNPNTSDLILDFIDKMTEELSDYDYGKKINEWIKEEKESEDN